MSVDRTAIINKITTLDGVSHEVVPTKLTDSSTNYSASLPTLTADSTLIIGSGTSGSIAKFDGSSSIAAGPALGTDTTKYLRNDGTWSTPAGGGVGINSITSTDLIALKTAGTLTPGQQYKITDYAPTWSGDNFKMAGNQFDIIVVADSTTVINENCRFALHSGDTYFASCDLAAWRGKIKFEDVTVSSTVVAHYYIDWMVDEYNNECPYDFKNAQYLGSAIIGGVSKYSLVATNYYYTFTTSASSAIDTSLLKSNNVYSNKIIWKSSITTLPVICFIGNNCYSNTFGTGCSYNTFGNKCYSNTFGNICFYNTFGNDCHYNTFGNACSYNTFKDYYRYNNLFNGISCVKTTVAGTYSAYIQNFVIEEGFSGASYSNQLDLSFSGLAGRSYPTIFTKDSAGNYIAKWHNTLLTTTGKYKAAVTDTTWTNITPVETYE